MKAEILPDSRLLKGDSTHGSVIVDWETVGGGTVRIEVVPVFCASCGTPYGHVPKENTTFACWLCRECAQQYGPVAGLWEQPDEEFCRAVSAEMQARFGRDLSDLELFQLAEQNQLGKELELLARESPYKLHRPTE